MVLRRKSPDERSLEWWLGVAVGVLDMANDVAKRDELPLVVRGPIEDAVISLHDARRMNALLPPK